MTTKNPEDYINAIRESGFTIYEQITIGDPDLWIPTDALENILNKELVGISVEGMALRTRSKFVKERICDALGYPIPKSFKKTQPRFLGQQFDTYTQKNNNLQIWNEELSSTRRYVLVRISAEYLVSEAKVVTGDMLAKLDTTGTLTTKYQASCVLGDVACELGCEPKLSY